MIDIKSLGIGGWLRIFWRRKWYFLAVAILVSAGVTIYAMRLPQSFTSETSILVESAIIAEDYVRPAERSNPVERINAVRQQIDSRKFLQRIVEDMQLNGFGTRKDFVMEDAIRGLRSSITVGTTTGNMFKLSYSATEPRSARDVTKRLADVLVQSNNSARKTRALETDQFIDEQLRQIDGQLTAQEEKIKKFKTDHLGELPEQGSANINTLNTLNTQLAGVDNAIQQATDQRKLLELRRSRLEVLARAFPTAPPAGSVPETKDKPAPVPVQNPVLLALRAELSKYYARGYRDDHPDVKRMINEIRRLEEQAANSAADAKAAESTALTPLGSGMKPVDERNPANAASATLVDMESETIKLEMEKVDNELIRQRKEREEILKRMKIVEGRLKQAPAMEQALAVLIREHDSLRAQYNNLQQKKFSTTMAANLETDPNAEIYKVIDEANLPEKSAFPNRVQIILMGVAGGIVLGLGAAFAREYLDPRLRDEEEVTAVLKLPVLASIPEIPNEAVPLRRRLPKAAGSA
jgi:polysaccharide chain length determinant protein (PEP-CTERM system associated)